MKILIIRFSSIGDIVLTTPVIRSLRKHYPACEIHYLTKSAYIPLLQHNPHLTAVHGLTDNFSQLIDKLQAEAFDYVLDLHTNIRSWRVKRALGRPSRSLNKENWKKYRMTRFKHRHLKIKHIVNRYGDTMSLLGVSLDDEGLDLFLPQELEALATSIFQTHEINPDIQKVLAVVLGASYPTKRWKSENFAPLLNMYRAPVLLIGGQDTQEEAQKIGAGLNVPFMDAVGKYDLLTSAALMKKCHEVLAHDTGFMHIAAAFRQPVYSIWGNTIPGFGMTPYKTRHKIIEVEGLDCRPCSKLGFEHCPRGHFRCMNDLTPKLVLEHIHNGAWMGSDC